MFQSPPTRYPPGTTRTAMEIQTEIIYKLSGLVDFAYLHRSGNRPGKSLVNHRKTIGKPWENGGLASGKRLHNCGKIHHAI